MATEFKKFINELVENISDYRYLISEFEKAEVDFLINDIGASNYKILKKQVEESKGKEAKLYFFIRDIYSKSLANNYFYFDCPLKVYINHFDERFKQFNEYVLDADLLDFIKHEILIFNNPKKNRILTQITDEKHPSKVYYNDHFSFNDNRYFTSFTKKLNFVSEKAQQFGYKIEFQGGVEYYDEHTERYAAADILATLVPLTKEEIEPTIIENTNQLTTNQIVLLLQETGFFTHPKIEDASKVKQAELISLITGIHEKTIKTNIQKLDNKPSDVTANYKKDIDKISKILDDLT
jgi:hypothetical protein